MSRRSQRRKVSNEERKNEVNIESFRLELVKELFKFHHTLQYHVWKNSHDFRNNFLLLSEEEKVSKLLGIDRKTGVNGITCTLRKVPMKSVNLLHSMYVSKEETSKDRMCLNLARHFYGEILDKKKRNEENENLCSFDLNIDYRFQKLCETVVTFEIMQIIFSYVGINSESFFSVSSVNKTFYIYALRCFHEIKLTKANLYQVSTLALRSTRKVNIVAKYKKDRLDEKELGYLFDELSQNKNLKTIHVCLPASLQESFFMTLRSYVTKKGNSSRSITNVESLHLNIWVFHYSRLCEIWDSSVYEMPKGTKLTDIFNNLRKVTAHLSLIMLQGLNTVESLHLGFDKTNYDDYTYDIRTIYEEELDRAYSIHGFMHINTENLKSLSLEIPALRSTTYDFLFNDDQFSKLEEIRFLPCYVGHVSEPKKLLNFSDYLRSSISADHPCLRTLVIRIPMDYKVLIKKTQEPVDLKLPNNHPSIENLEVYFIDWKPNYGSTTPFDTTFSAISSGWVNLKSFRGSLSYHAGITSGLREDYFCLKGELFDRMDSLYLEIQMVSEITLLKIDWKKKRRAFHGGSVVIQDEAEVDIVFMGDDLMNKRKEGNMGKKLIILRKLLEMMMQKYESDEDTNNVKLLRMRVLLEKGLEENADVMNILGNCMPEAKRLEVLKAFPERYRDLMKENARRGRSRSRARYECELSVYEFERE